MKRFNVFNREIANVYAAALTIGAAGLLSRLLGVVRDRMLAARFGAGRELDIYYAAFQIPDFLFTLFLLGAASAAVIPALIDEERRSPAEGRRFIRELATVFFIGSLAVWMTAVLAAPFLVRLLAPGFAPSDQALLAVLARIMMVSPVLLGLSNIVSSVVQTHRRFFSFALSSVFYNLGIILGILFFLPAWGMAGLAAGVVLGALLHLAVQAPALYSLGFGWPLVSPGFLRRGFSAPVKKVFALSVPRVVALSAGGIADIAFIAIASAMGSGSIAVFKFAQNLRFVPIGLFGVSFAVAAYPALSGAGARENAPEFYSAFFGTLRSILFWILPIASLFYVLRAQIVRVALGAGAFSWQDTRLTAAILGIMAFAIVAESLSSLLIRSFYALGNTVVPFFVNAVSAFGAVALAVVLAHAFENPGNPLFVFLVRILRVDGVAGSGVLGLALGAAAGSVLDSALLFWGLKRVMRRRLGRLGIKKYADLRDVPMMGVSAVCAGFAAYGMLRVANEFVTLDRFSGVLVQGAVSSLVGAMVYLGMLYLAKNREIAHLTDAVRRRLFSVRILPQEWNGETSKS